MQGNLHVPFLGGWAGAIPPSYPAHAIPVRVNGPYSTQRPDPPVEGGRPRSRDGNLLCPAQLPGAPHTLATDDLIRINSLLSLVIGLPHVRKKRRGLMGRGVSTRSRLFRRNPVECAFGLCDLD